MTNSSGAFTDTRLGRDVDIVFSLRDGLVWASWPATRVSIRLGSHDVVAAMMRDFLAQDAVAEQLNARKRGVGSKSGPRLPADRDTF